jgi:hypothetical protein
MRAVCRGGVAACLLAWGALPVAWAQSITATPLLPPPGVPQVPLAAPSPPAPPAPAAPASPAAPAAPGFVPAASLPAAVPPPSTAPQAAPPVQAPPGQQPAQATPPPGQPTAPGAEAPAPGTFTPAPAVPVIWQPEKSAVLQILDKVSARSSTITVKVGSTAQYGPLSIAARACDVTTKDEAANATAFLDITDGHPDAPGFHGWMLASDPSVSMLQHPVYDVRVVGCGT